MHQQAPPQKKNLIESMLNNGLVMIVVDARKKGVELPADLLQDSRVALNLSWKFRAYMELKEESIHALLRFSGKEFLCVIPWNAIWMVKQNKDGIVFPESLPDQELLSVKAEKLQEICENKPRFATISGGGELSEARQNHLKMLH